MYTEVTLKARLQASLDPEELPVRIRDAAAQQAEIEALKRALEADGVSAHLSTSNKRPVLDVHVLGPGSDSVSWGHRHSVGLRVFFEGDALHVRKSYGGAGSTPLSGLPQLRRAIAAVREMLAESHRRDQKREKIRKLKERSVEAQIGELAARLGLHTAIERRHTKIKLYVKLDDKSALCLDIPHGDPEQALAGLGDLVQRARALCASGARFEILSARGHSFRPPKA